jgi:hypothetical protein
MSRIHWVVWGTGTPKDRDEANTLHRCSFEEMKKTFELSR